MRALRYDAIVFYLKLFIVDSKFERVDNINEFLAIRWQRLHGTRL